MPRIPWTTLAIGVVGSFVLGFLARAVVAVPTTAVGAASPAVVSGPASAVRAPVPLGPTAGVCGGFTTCSAIGVGAAFLGATPGRMARSAG